MTKSKQVTKKMTNKRRRLSEESTMVTAPAAGGTIFRNPQPKIRSQTGSLTVSHCEPFFTLNGGVAGAFVTGTGNMAPFNLPWLNGVAVNYSKWRWVSLDIIYIPSVPTTTTGEMCIALQYDNQDSAVTTFAQLQTIYKAVSTPVWAGYEGSVLLNRPELKAVPGAIVLPVDVNRFGLKWYRYVTGVTFTTLSPADRNNYCPVILVGGDQGAPGAVLLGRVFARYTIELIEPMPAAINV